MSNAVMTGTIGFIASIMLSIPAYIESIEAIIRFISLGLSITVALLTIVKLSKEITGGRKTRTRK